MTTDLAVAAAMGAMPDRIEFYGGPYCGAILFPQLENITDVHRDENGGLIPVGDLPSNFSPVGWNLVVLHGPSGQAIYTMESECRWSFVSFVELVEESPDA